MPRVAFLLPDFRIGGAERVALTLIKEFLDRGIEVDLVLMRAEGDLLQHLPADVELISLDVARIRHAIRPFTNYLRDRQPDAVQVRMWPLTLVPLIARWLVDAQTRIVTSDHEMLSEANAVRRPSAEVQLPGVGHERIVTADDTMLSERFAGRGPLHWMFLRWSIAFAYPRAEGRVAVSHGVARDLAQLGRIDRQSISVLANPVALAPPAPPALEPDWGGEGKRILAVGSLKPVKNHALLLRAFARALKVQPVRLAILGEGGLRVKLETLAQHLGIADHVIMPGWVVDPSSYYASADVLVLSSDHEGFGNVLVEALNHGLTVVSTDCPAGPREILEDGRFGYLVPCGDDDALARAINQACDTPFPPELLRDRAHELSGPQIVDQYLSLLLPDQST